MSRRRKTSEDPALQPVPAEILDAFVADGALTAGEIDAAMRRFKKALIERALGGELTHHLGYPPGAKPEEARNQRNGTTTKTVLTDDGPVTLDVPRDRDGTFDPVLLPKHERRFTGFDDKILALYARGLTVRDIQAFLAEMYATDVSPDLISTVTDAVVSEVTAWQARPLERVYAVVFFDALRVKIRDEGVVRSKAVYLALGVRTDGARDILGLWIEQTEGAKFWLKVFTDLRSRGCEDILIAVTDGLKGMPEALDAAYPQTTLQTCIVHLIRHSLAYANYRDRQRLADALKTIYTAPTEDAARATLDTLEASPLGAPVSECDRRVASGVDARGPVFRVSPDDSARAIHDERARKHSSATAQDHQDAGALSHRRGRHEAPVARAAEHHPKMGGAGEGLVRRHEPLCDSLRRPIHP